MNRLRRLTRPQWAIVLAVIVLAAGGITVAALALGGRSRPAVQLQVTNPSPANPGQPAPATSGPRTPAPTSQPVPSGTPASPGPITPPPRAYTASPRPSPTTPAHGASPSPPMPGAVETPNCPLNMKCTMPCPDACAQPAAGDVQLITDADNGKTVRVTRGSRVSVQLASTYWTFTPVSDAAVLVAQGPQQTAPCAARTLPGSGCGTATVTYAAEAAGTAVVAAQRTTCGEAMLCVAGQGAFRVTVVVA